MAVPFAYSEYVEDIYPANGVFGGGSDSVATILDVLWDDMDEAMRELIGWTEVKGAGLTRIVPVAHPRFPRWYCTRIIDYKPLGPTDKITPINTNNKALPFQTKYDKVRLTCLFQPLPYDVLPDDAAQTDEFYRYVSPKFATRNATFAVDKGSVGYKGTTRFVGEFQTARAQYCDIEWIWWMVPEKAFLGKLGLQGGVPINHLYPGGCVNSMEFHGYPPLVLYFRGAEAIAHNFGLMPSDKITNQRYYDIHIRVTYFSPLGIFDLTKPTDDPNYYQAANRGNWNYVPYRQGWAEACYLAPGAAKINPTYDGPSIMTPTDFNSFLFKINPQ